MLTGCSPAAALLISVLIASSGQARVAAGRRPLTLAQTSRVKVRRGAELTLNCGGGEHAGVVQYWHTPFGCLQNPGTYSSSDPITMQDDGNLVLVNTSHHHTGLYYCLLQAREGTTLWPYQIQIGHSKQIIQDHRGLLERFFKLIHSERAEPQTDDYLKLCDSDHRVMPQESRPRMLRLRRDSGGPGSQEERQPDISDAQFAGAVVGSVILTFLLGFSAGALSRAHVLRCLGAVTERARSLRQWVSSTDSTDDNWEVTMTTTYDSEEHDHVNSVMGNLMETTVSSTASSPPPTKPKRSFRHKQELQPETAEVYLERCDPAEEEEERGAEKERETSSDSLSGENGSSDDQQLSTGTDKEREENEGRTGHSWEENGGLREEEEKVEGMKVAGKASQQGREEKKVEEVGEDSVEREVEEVGRRREAAEEPEGESRASGEDNRSRSSADAGDDDGSDGGGGSEDKHERENSITGSDEQEEGSSPNSSSTPCPARRSRVIRLYQYDEDGQRYSHLPNPAPDKSAPAPRLKQRSLSLTRLNAIIAAASAGPLDTTGREAEEERDSLSSPTSPSGAVVFHLEI